MDIPKKPEALAPDPLSEWEERCFQIVLAASAPRGWYEKTTEQLTEIVQLLREVLGKFNAVGITLIPGLPVERTPKMDVKLVKKSAVLTQKRLMALNPGVKAGSDFVLIDNEDVPGCTVQGTDSAGSPVDISQVATITVMSTDPTIISVDTPVGMTFGMHGIKASVPGTPVNVVAVAKWNDGSIGPFTFTLPCDVLGSAATGITIVPGTPTVR